MTAFFYQKNEIECDRIVYKEASSFIQSLSCFVYRKKKYTELFIASTNSCVQIETLNPENGIFIFSLIRYRTVRRNSTMT